MPPDWPQGQQGSQPIHAVIAADIKDFTGNTDTENRMLARRLPQVLKRHSHVLALTFPA